MLNRSYTLLDEHGVRHLAVWRTTASYSTTGWVVLCRFLGESVDTLPASDVAADPCGKTITCFACMQRSTA